VSALVRLLSLIILVVVWYLYVFRLVTPMYYVPLLTVGGVLTVIGLVALGIGVFVLSCFLVAVIFGD
jgi:type III secretory pathway component EscU